MNLPNKLTIIRLILVPFYVFFLMTDFFAGTSIVALVIFVAASLTDLFDGKIARKYDLISDFGKFADPLADKILVTCALVCFSVLGKMPFWVCLIILSREFAISGFRLVAAGNGNVIAASKWGKVKTATQMAMAILLTFDMALYAGKYSFPSYVLTIYDVFAYVLIYASLFFTIVSMVDYFHKNRKSFTINK